MRFTASGPLNLASRPEEQFSQLRATVLECQTNGAEAVIVAGGPLGVTARRLSGEKKPHGHGTDLAFGLAVGASRYHVRSTSELGDLLSRTQPSPAGSFTS